jgi:hypothetical protein
VPRPVWESAVDAAEVGPSARGAGARASSPAWPGPCRVRPTPAGQRQPARGKGPLGRRQLTRTLRSAEAMERVAGGRVGLDELEALDARD